MICPPCGKLTVAPSVTQGPPSPRLTPRQFLAGGPSDDLADTPDGGPIDIDHHGGVTNRADEPLGRPLPALEADLVDEQRPGALTAANGRLSTRIRHRHRQGRGE